MYSPADRLRERRVTARERATEARRNRVLRMLAKSPQLRYAVAVDEYERDEVVVIAMAIRVPEADQIVSDEVCLPIHKCDLPLIMDMLENGALH